MKSTLKLFILSLLFSVFHQTAIAQDANKTVTITVSGSGKTQYEAKQVALRSAIEQAFGAFISSKTEILNDNLVKDEIVSVTNGNIQKFDVLSEVQIPDGGYATTLKAVVSVAKLTSFCESKGVMVEFKGSNFAMNIKLQKLNEEAEYKAILNLCTVSKDILSKSIDFSLNASNPIAYDGSSDLFSVLLTVDCKSNGNYLEFKKYFWTTLANIAMTQEDNLNYNTLKLPIYIIRDYNDIDNKYNNPSNSFSFRNKSSLLAINNLIMRSNSLLLNFYIYSEVDSIYVKKCCKGDVYNDTHNIIRHEAQNDKYDKWLLNFKEGYPPAGKNYDNGLFKSTGEIFYNFMISNENILKSPMYDENDFFKWQNPWGQIETIIYSSKDEYNFQFTYNHILALSKLEKITKYQIVPWHNNYPKLLNLKDYPEWLKWFSANLKQGSDRNKVIKTLIENNFSKKSISDAEIKFIDLGLNIKEYPEWNNWFQNSLKMDADRNVIIQKLFQNGFSEKSIIEAGKDFNFIRTKYGCYEYTEYTGGKKGSLE
jgi:hypothetical protein